MLSARAFYAVIVAGVLLGLLTGAGGAWVFLMSQPPQPDRPRELLIPIAAMITATFGGIAGVAAAVRLDLRRRTRDRIGKTADSVACAASDH